VHCHPPAVALERRTASVALASDSISGLKADGRPTTLKEIPLWK
jgi:hypothetical protein